MTTDRKLGHRIVRVEAVHHGLRAVPCFHAQEWGPWFLYINDGGTGWLDHETVPYEVTLMEATTAAEITGTIFQVASKNWATPDTVSGLVYALNDILAPQANICSSRRRMTRDAVVSRLQAVQRSVNVS